MSISHFINDFFYVFSSYFKNLLYLCDKTRPKKGIKTMNIEHFIERIEKSDGLSKTLGMHFISTPEPDTLQASMKVDERNKQPFGFLSGGASLALAENLAGVGSLATCPGQIAVGINVSGTHVLAVSEGDTVTAYGKLVHKGRTLHTWQVEIRNSAGDLICTVQVTNYVFTPKKDNKKVNLQEAEDTPLNKEN